MATTLETDTSRVTVRFVRPDAASGPGPIVFYLDGAHSAADALSERAPGPLYGALGRRVPDADLSVRQAICSSLSDGASALVDTVTLRGGVMHLSAAARIHGYGPSDPGWA